MLGHSHALSGGVAGLAAGIFMHLPIPQTAALAGFTAGMALLPDLDKCGSSPARSLGFVSEAVAWVFGRISGGHRHATPPPRSGTGTACGSFPSRSCSAARPTSPATC